MKLMIDISKDRYDEIMAMDWKNCRLIFDEEIRAIHDGKALQQEPCEDAISRQEVIDAIFYEPLYKSGMKKRYAEEAVPAIFEKIKKLPPVTPQPCEDAISRQAVLDLPKNTERGFGGKIIEQSINIEYIKALPLVTPQPNKCGEWSDDGFCGDCVCSVCKHEFDWDIANMRGFDFALPKFCPNCGAKMQEVKE